MGITIIRRPLYSPILVVFGNAGQPNCCPRPSGAGRAPNRPEKRAGGTRKLPDHDAARGAEQRLRAFIQCINATSFYGYAHKLWLKSRIGVI